MNLISVARDGGIIIASFFIGAIPFCYMLGKIVSGKRLSEIGDKNPGGWNLVFNVSKIWGFIGILLDMAKGYLVYFFALRLASEGFVSFLGTTNAQAVAILAGCAAVLGHNYTPFLKFKGGKGLATWGGLVIAGNPMNLAIGGVALLLGLVVAKNMIWSVILGIVSTGIFLWLTKNTIAFGIMIILLLIIMIPKQVNREKSLSENFRFRKESSLGDLFKPKIR